LTDDHRCPRRPALTALEIGLAALTGGLAGLVVVALADPSGALPHLDAMAVTIGVFAGIGLDRLLRG
jgi:hypothetical protein